jgi:hypothetical protein
MCGEKNYFLSSEWIFMCSASYDYYYFFHTEVYGFWFVNGKLFRGFFCADYFSELNGEKKLWISCGNEVLISVMNNL